MTRQNEAGVEQKQARRVETVGKCVEYQLEGHLHRAGVVLNGISLRVTEDECLMVVRGVLGSDSLVAFVGSGDMAGCFIKATSQAKDDKLNWKPDRYASE